MKVIDLLNKIANNEEVPRIITFGDIIYTYDEEVQDYTDSGDEYLLYSIFNEKTEIALNEKVKVIENKTKQIEKIPISLDDNTNSIYIEYESCSNDIPHKIKSFSVFDIYISNKMNELIDKVNKLIEKGDEK